MMHGKDVKMMLVMSQNSQVLLNMAGVSSVFIQPTQGKFVLKATEFCGDKTTLGIFSTKDQAMSELLKLRTPFHTWSDPGCVYIAQDNTTFVESQA